MKPVHLGEESRSTRGAVAILAITVAVIGLSGCGSSTAGGATTCEEWLRLDDQLTFKQKLADSDGLSDQAAKVLKDALHDAGLSTDIGNLSVARYNVTQYCGTDDTGTRPNLHQPIDNALNSQ